MQSNSNSSKKHTTNQTSKHSPNQPCTTNQHLYQPAKPTPKEPVKINTNHKPTIKHSTIDPQSMHTPTTKGQCKHTHQHPTTHMCGQQVASEMSVTITLDTLLDFQPPHPHPTHNQQGCPQGGADQNSTTPTNQPQPHNRSHNQSEEQTKPNPCHTRTPTTSFF